MKNLIVSGVALLGLLIAPLASAQTYYPTYYNGMPAEQVGCISIPVGLTTGSRGTSVLTLQNFLIARNYPGGGSWMATSYFGPATQAAVRNFQQSQYLPQSGMVDAATAIAISRVSCPFNQGAMAVLPSLSQTPTYPYTYPQQYSNYYPSYLSTGQAGNNYYGNNYYGTAPAITSLSQNTGMPGNVVTIYGVGFDQWNNTVNFGGTMLPNVPSNNGISLTFTIPSNYYSYSLAGTAVQLSVANSRGTSNALSFTVWGTQNNCGLYGNSCGCNYNGYNYLPTGQAGNTYYPYNSTYGYINGSCLPPNTATPVINYLSPTFGAVGTSVSVYGTGFSTSGNTVHFGTGIITNLNSYDGRSVSFTVPNTLTGYGNQPITLSTYQVSVSNSAGITSGSVPFTVTGTISSPYAQSAAVSITNFAFNPVVTTVRAGTTITWTNNDAVSHTVTSDNSAFIGSSTLAPGQTFSATFNTLGTFTYHCAIHPGMIGTVVVTQ